MYKPSKYEDYLINETIRYGFFTTPENDFPSWLNHEKQVYNWCRKFYRLLWMTLTEGGSVSGNTLKRLENVKTSRYLKYKNISPSCRKMLEQVICELNVLNAKMQNEYMWKRKHYLSEKGIAVWRQSTDEIHYILHKTHPNPDWRDNWERKIMGIMYSRREAEKKATFYMEMFFNIDFNKRVSYDKFQPVKLYHKQLRAKDNIFTMKVIKNNSQKLNDYTNIATVVIDMKNGQAKIITELEIKVEKEVIECFTQVQINQ